MTPFYPKGLINPSLNTRFPGGPKGVDGLPSGHPNFDSSHPGLLKDFRRGILIIEMLLAFLRPKEVEDEVMKDVKRLFDVGKAPYMVPLNLGKSASLSKMASPSMTNGQERMTSLGTPH